MFILKNLMIEAKRSKLILNCESSEAKRNERIYSQKSNLQSEANWFILKFYNIEAKRTGSLVILYLNNNKKANFRFFKNERQKTKGFDSKLSKFCHYYAE